MVKFTFINLNDIKVDILDNQNNNKLVENIISSNNDVSYIKNFKSINKNTYNRLVYNKYYANTITFIIDNYNVNCIIKLNHLLNNDFNNNPKNVIVKKKSIIQYFYNSERAIDEFKNSINKFENEEEIIYKFNFSFTTNDSDITIFEPFIKYLDCLFFNNYKLKLSDKDIDQIFELIRNKKISNDEINDYKNNIKNKLNKLFFDTIENIHEDKNLYNKKYKKYLQPLINTLINVKIEYEFSKYFTLPLDKKICPHVKKRIKN